MEDALLALLDERRYPEITVKGIAAEAGVSRATFYAHFVNKDDLFRTFLRNSVDRVVAKRREDSAGSERSGEAYLETLLPAVFEHADRLAGKWRSAKAGRGAPPPEGELQIQLQSDVLRWLETLPGSPGAEARRNTALAVSAMVANVAVR